MVSVPSDMTTAEARKILGKLAQNVSDEALAEDIKMAEFLKDVFFSNVETNNQYHSPDAR